ncbi:hypothetical protein I302_102897 [Kwoniella bestiolae CBS 10118]|uniref:Uncharacterized protein n=1 Tax=Kwoniella bestiolae CBS 10118 TaxID=1296100 RepID=A0A1B9GG93_9TREE|nr:hypothetical protein I302_01592 [Kwoniella bestiolae CBS 10118]OCF30073.1 hypothetical protein I302_01592 [Kwoniella bestiolae CBS 10118]
MSTEIYTTPRERMFKAKLELLEAEQEERIRRKQARRESRKLSQAISLNDEAAVASSSRLDALATPSSSILRKSSALPLPSAFQPPKSPQPTQDPQISSSPAPCLPLPPAPLTQNTDFGPPIHLPSPSASGSITNGVRRRSSRVRFSDQQLQPNQAQTLIVSRSTSLKSQRRESSIDGLLQDLMHASNSLNNNGRKHSTASNHSLSRRVSSNSLKRASFASSVGSDPFNWATSSFGSTSEIDLEGTVKHNLEELDMELLQSEIEMRMNEERDGMGFNPQLLPYPKVSKQLSRLSIESTGSSVWLTQDHMVNLSEIGPSESDTQSMFNPQRSSWASTTSMINDQSRKSSQFSLEAQIISNSISRKSSYAPSSITDRDDGLNTPSSLRSSTSEDILPNTTLRSDSANSSISMSFQLPPRAHTLAYSSLLPSRRRRSSLLVQGGLVGGPNINRGEWDDPELGLSPRSGPTRILGSLSSVISRRGTKLAEEIIERSSSEVGRSRGDIEETTNRPVETEVEVDGRRHEMEEEFPVAVKGHTRSESTFSAIMAFPIPPDRIIEAITPRKDTEKIEVHEELPIELPGGSVEKVIEISLNPEMTVSQLVQPISMAQGSEESQPLRLEVSLNSPFVEVDQTCTFPSVEAIEVDTHSPLTISDRVEEVEEVQPVIVSDPIHLSCPSSPELDEILRTVTRPRRSRRSVGATESTETETEESDLDVASPLVKVALISHILSPKSRLLSTSPSPSRPASLRSVSANSVSTLSSLRSGLGLTSGRGWSGSESEEEDWISTVRDIRERKTTPTEIRKMKRKSEGLTIQVEAELDLEDTPTTIKTKRFSTSSTSSSTSKNKNRYSQLSEMSTTTTSESHLPLTPLSLGALTPTTVGLTRTNSNASTSSIANSQSSKPGNFPWGLSSPPNSPIRGLFVNNLSPSREFFTSFRDTSRTVGKKNRGMKKELPKPKREDELEDWGEPEILIDEIGFGSLESSDVGSLRGSISTLSLRSDISILAERYGGESRRSTIKLGSTSAPGTTGRSESPDLWMDLEGERSLMDEEMPEM